MSRAMGQLAAIPQGRSLEDYAARVILSAWVLTGTDRLPSNMRVLSRAVADLRTSQKWPTALQQRIFLTDRFDGPEWEPLPYVMLLMQSFGAAGFNNPSLGEYSPKISVADAVDQGKELGLGVDDLESIGQAFRTAIEKASSELSYAS